ncbi:helix-turn-helix domain-containing protein, partial [Streptomyces sp. NPDC001185]|uniref:helix-turn-helix domain-containing protein n=1 Tax=Streptomyces sp. NPDC001185 TaxID=3154380 RepID=UPI0033221C2A
MLAGPSPPSSALYVPRPTSNCAGRGELVTGHDAIDALLAAASPDRAQLPPAEERRRLREELHLSRAQLAAALGVSASTVAGW